MMVNEQAVLDLEMPMMKTLQLVTVLSRALLPSYLTFQRLEVSGYGEQPPWVRQVERLV